MNISEFYRRVLPVAGQFCLVAPRMQHYWFDDQESLAVATEERVGKEAGWYYGTAGYDGTKSRKQENVVAVKSLRIDIDAGAEKLAKHGIEKVYESQETALAHVAEFNEWAGFAPTIVVSSGSGLHLYYTFDSDFPSVSAWKAASTALARMAREFGLKVDTTCTTDEARILRPIGALHKNGNTVEVISSREEDITLADFVAAFKAKGIKAEAVPAAVKNINADLDMPPPVFAPSSVEKVANKCIWMREMLDANGSVGYQNWFLAAGLYKHCVEGYEGFHAWSSGASDYSASEADLKYNSWSAGPTTCAKVAEENDSTCRRCPHYGQVTSPIGFGRLSDTQAAAVKEEKAAAMTAEFGGFLGSDDADDEEQSAPADTNALPGRTPVREILERVRAFDQRDKLIAAGLLPESFPTTEALMDYSNNALFFVQRNRAGHIVLCAYAKETTETDDGGSSTNWISMQLTEQPFYVNSYVQGSGQSESLIEYLKQYDMDGNPEWDYTEFSTTDLYDNNGFRNAIANMGVTYIDAGKQPAIFKMLKQFTSANLSVLRKRPATLQVQHHFGFQFLNRNPLYVQGSYAAKSDGTVETCALGPDLRSMQTQFEMPCISSDALRAYQGDAFNEVILPSAQKFCEGVSVLYGGEQNARYQLGWLLGVSSPYLTFLTDDEPSPESKSMPGMGIALAFYSTGSGLGKTTLQKAINEAFLQAEENKAGGDKGSGISAIALGVQLARLGSLPYMLDEVTNNDPEEVSELIHKISIGRDKVRAQQNGRAAARTGSWTSVTTMSTNVSQRVLLTQHRSSSSAEQMRVVEVDFEHVTPGKITEFVDKYNQYLSRNRGALGMVLGRYGVMNWEQMRVDAMRLMDAVIQKFKMPNSERYFARILAAALLAAQVMKKHGMEPVDATTILKEFALVLEEAREYVLKNTPDADDYAERMVRDLMPRLVRTRTETDNRGARLHGGDPTYDIVENPEVLNRARIAGRYVASTGRLYVVSGEFNAWCAKNAIDGRWLLGKWAEAGLYATGSGPKPKRLNIGVHKNVMPDMNPRCYSFNLASIAAKLDMQDGELPSNVVGFASASQAAGPAPGPEDGYYEEGVNE